MARDRASACRALRQSGVQWSVRPSEGDGAIIIDLGPLPHGFFIPSRTTAPPPSWATTPATPSGLAAALGVPLRAPVPPRTPSDIPPVDSVPLSTSDPFAEVEPMERHVAARTTPSTRRSRQRVARIGTVALAAVGIASGLAAWLLR